jgi:hypothetical protein
MDPFDRKRDPYWRPLRFAAATPARHRHETNRNEVSCHRKPLPCRLRRIRPSRWCETSIYDENAQVSPNRRAQHDGAARSRRPVAARQPAPGDLVAGMPRLEYGLISNCSNIVGPDGQGPANTPAHCDRQVPLYLFRRPATFRPGRRPAPSNPVHRHAAHAAASDDVPS